MIWDSLSDFVAMGGYGLYVWGSYGVTAAALALEIFTLVRRHARSRARAVRRSAA